MLGRLRTYRILPFAIALMLALGGSVPLVRHVCAMAGLPGMAEMAHRHCDKMAEHQESVMVHPCHDAVGLRALPEALSHTDCCVVQAAHGQPEAVPVSLPIVEPLLSLTAGILFMPLAPRRAAILSGDSSSGPPLPSSVSLNVLHGSFLI